MFLEKYNFNDYIEVYSDEEYFDDPDEKIKIIKCTYLYLQSVKKYSGTTKKTFTISKAKTLYPPAPKLILQKQKLHMF